ncbi:hypothetical protein DPMN_099723 [Dreissena polymorpha]|uniref:Uncharacterized protein n=1 Tax=Dreissena polymorpha TaxID=45954 RepID=A0A9D4LEM3_DREPO|nr:hypothetical protein DPMN_099723 [Dreissena polymorpha]
MGHKTPLVVPKRMIRSKNAKALTSLCIIALQKKSYPKEALAVSYARSYWPLYKCTWFENASIQEDVEIDFFDQLGKLKDRAIFKPVSSSEYSLKRH